MKETTKLASSIAINALVEEEGVGSDRVTDLASQKTVLPEKVNDPGFETVSN